VILVAFVALAIGTVPLARGSLRALADVRFRAGWLLGVAIAAQLWALLAPDTAVGARAVVHTLTYPAGIAFIWVNRRIPGLWIVGLGATLNLIVIAANGGVMPAAPHALAIAGLPADPGTFVNSGAIADARLAFLGDIFAIPASWPLANVFSPGDACIAIGAAVTIHRVAGSRLAPSATGQFGQVLRNRDFFRLWAAQGISNLGDWVYALAVAATLSQRAGGGELARTLSIVLVAQVAPSALFGALLAGPLADRYSRRSLMVWADVARGAALATLLFTPEPTLLHFALVGAALGLFGAAFQPSLMAAIPNVVGPGRIVAANALVGATYHAAVMLGPALGAFLVANTGTRIVFALNATSFILSGLLILGARVPQVARDAGAATVRAVARDLADGVRYVWRSALVRGVLIVVALVLVAAAAKTPLETLFVRDVLTEDATFAERARVLGLVTTSWGLGMLLGSFAAPALARRWHRERLLRLSIAAVGLAVLVVSRTTEFGTVLIAWLVAGAANSVGNVSYESLLQERTPDEYRGRVFAATEAVLDAAYLGGAAAAAVLASLLPVSAAFAVSAAILFLAAVLARVLLPGPRAPKPEEVVA
jgi:MFS family permease